MRNSARIDPLVLHPFFCQQNTSRGVFSVGDFWLICTQHCRTISGVSSSHLVLLVVIFRRDFATKSEIEENQVKHKQQCSFSRISDICEVKIVNRRLNRGRNR